MQHHISYAILHIKYYGYDDDSRHKFPPYSQACLHITNMREYIYLHAYVFEVWHSIFAEGKFQESTKNIIILTDLCRFRSFSVSEQSG